MEKDSFKRFAIRENQLYPRRYGYMVIGDLENKTLTYRDMHTRKDLMCYTGCPERDAAMAYRRALVDAPSKEFTTYFELTSSDADTLSEMLVIDEFIRAKAAAKIPVEEFLVCDDTIGMELAFEGYAGSPLPLFQIKNERDYWDIVPPLHRLKDYLDERFNLKQFPGHPLHYTTLYTPPKRESNSKKRRRERQRAIRQANA